MLPNIAGHITTHMFWFFLFDYGIFRGLSDRNRLGQSADLIALRRECDLTSAWELAPEVSKAMPGQGQQGSAAHTNFHLPWLLIKLTVVMRNCGERTQIGSCAPRVVCYCHGIPTPYEVTPAFSYVQDISELQHRSWSWVKPAKCILAVTI